MMIEGMRRCARAAIACVLIALAVAAWTVAGEQPVAAARATKYEVCHRTNAIKNPYRRISVAWSALGRGGNGHGGHDPDWPFDVSDPVGTHGATPRDRVRGGGDDRWGDVFRHERNGSVREQNWPAGQAIFDGTATFQLAGETRVPCRRMTAMEYIESELQAGTPLAEVMADLDGQGASEDVIFRSLLPGGSFTGWYATLPPGAGMQQLLATAPTGPTATTAPAVASSCTSAVLSGDIDPRGLALAVTFELSTDPGFATVQELDAGSTSVPLHAEVTATGLTPATTYHARIVGTVTSGSGDDAVTDETRGAPVSFATPKTPYSGFMA